MAHRAGLDQRTVIQAAADLADKIGLEEVTLATLAARLGIRAPTLYHYVNGLDGLRSALAVLGARSLARLLGEAV
ncbi:MAG: TetR family transcriptional regulator, partial [Ktedonobacteraceae bacterium]